MRAKQAREAVLTALSTPSPDGFLPGAIQRENLYILSGLKPAVCNRATRNLMKKGRIRACLITNNQAWFSLI